ncbi:MAG: peptide chain release factor N(5)-glutamine methyltransferase [bacterium]|nr:peptide chain release factor N(5)-glutamine methyltransferase [bacterium]MCM1375866.1 peptide chain release factor N(5)-glutamine methyltransferase [Muribaculum sp.]
MNYKDCYENGWKKLLEAGIEEAALDARLLLEQICGTDRNALLVHGDRGVSAQEQRAYEEAIDRRSRRIPLQQITGIQEFMGLTYQVNEHVLVPRQDTEILVEEVLRELMDGMRILDLCTGSGCILISLLHYSNGCEGVGIDISSDALAVARCNAAALLGADSRYNLLESDLFAQVEGRYDIIVSNPPYICHSEIENLMPEVRDHEPMLALDGGEDGLDYYRRIVAESPAYLNGGGRLYLEIGCDQGDAVQKLLLAQGFREVNVVQDYAGLDRVVSGYWPIL